MPDQHIPLEPDRCYHLFSRAVGRDNLFYRHENYTYFLTKLKHHSSAICSVFAYSLLPNHFHLLIRIKSEADLLFAWKAAKAQHALPDSIQLSEFAMERFSNWLNGYAKAINKQQNRKGALFMDYLKRSEVIKDSDFSAFVWYIHKNAVHHGLAAGIGEWPHDSYASLISNSPTSLLRDEVLEWFGGKEQFAKFHQWKIELKKPWKNL